MLARAGFPLDTLAELCASVVPPNLTRLHYIHQSVESSDWSYSRIRVGIIGEVVLHVSVILATVPCIKPWLVVFERGAALYSRPTPHEEPQPVSSAGLKLKPLLPVARPNIPHRRSLDTALFHPGRVGHRKRVEAWPLQTHQQQTLYTTTVESPAAGRMADRKKSVESSNSSIGITQTKSFSVEYTDIDYFMHGTRLSDEAPPGRRPSMARTMTTQAKLADVGRLLEDGPKEPQKQRLGSVGSI